MINRLKSLEPVVSSSLLAETRGLSRPLRSEVDLGPLIDRLKDARVVLLGEASHGTHEYYTWRTAISKRLITEAGFSFIAVEGDWPDCYQVNRFVKGYSGAADDAEEVLRVFRRWPTWMWGNEEVLELTTWLWDWNDTQSEAKRVGFYGLDVYSLWESLYEVMGYLQKHQPEGLPAARKALRCFEPFGEDAQKYAHYTSMVPRSCQDEVVKLLGSIRTAAKAYDSDQQDGRFVAEQNALVVRNAEAYYRAMVNSDGGSWNIRDRHMAETLDRLLTHHGTSAKAIVWEHNTHVGDARFTDMADAGMVNIGQLARDAYGRKHVAIVGFGSYVGSVIAGDAWEAPWERMTVPEARTGSWESVFHEAGADDKFLIFNDGSSELSTKRGHRAIGVVYHPSREQFGNYVPTMLPQRYDAFVYLDRTAGVQPLVPAALEQLEELPETYPSGV